MLAPGPSDSHPPVSRVGRSTGMVRRRSKKDTTLPLNKTPRGKSSYVDEVLAEYDRIYEAPSGMKRLLPTLPIEEWDDVVATGYAVESFPIRKLDVISARDAAVAMASNLRLKPDDVFDGGWRCGYSEAHNSPKIDKIPSGLGLAEFRGHPVGAGVVVGIDERELMKLIAECISAI